MPSKITNNIKAQLPHRVESGAKNELMDLNFLSKVAPLGGLDFNDRRFVKTGTGYEACIYVYGYPTVVLKEWMAILTGIPDTVCVIDIASTNTSMVKRNLRRSLDEQSARANSAKSSGEFLDAQKQFSELEAIYSEINGYGNVVKAMLARIYVPGATQYEVDEKVGEIISDLEGDGFKACVCLDETESDFRNVFLSYNQQQREIYRRKGQEMLSKAIAGGQFFHFSALSDERGTFYGQTPTGGSVFLDLFYKSPQRLSYNLAIAGKMGVGKSTLLKKILVERAMRGDKVRVFDVSGEFEQLTKYLGGDVIHLDGGGKSIINILEIFPDEDQDTAFKQHIAKVTTIYRYLKKDDGTGKDEAFENEILVLKQLLHFLYIQAHICDPNGKLIVDLYKLKPENFPRISDLLKLTKNIIDNFDVFAAEFQRSEERLQGVLRESMLPMLQNIELKLSDLCLTYGNVFDGYTSIPNFFKKQIVTFNVSKLLGFEPEIFDAQIYNVLSLCWSNVVTEGGIMKDLYEANEIEWDDITRCLILIDEAHHLINANKLAGITEINRMMREGRKYFAGLGLASQSIRDFVPDRAESKAIEKIKGLFEFTTYKFIMNHDAASVPKLKEVFEATFTPEEIESVTALESRDAILSAGQQKLEFEIWAEPIVLELGAGGA